MTMKTEAQFFDHDGMPEISIKRDTHNGHHWIKIEARCKRTLHALAAMTFFGSPDYLRDLAANIEKAALVALEASEDMAEAEAYNQEKMAELVEEGREETLAGVDG